MKTTLLVVAVLTVGMALGQQNRDVRVGTYNIRMQCGEPGTADCWDERRDALVGQIRKMKLDVFGLQEVCPGQMAYLKGKLPEFAFVGDHREADRKSGEASPVVYRRDRFVAEKSGTFWLSETPEVPASKSWGTCCTRVCSYLVLSDKKTGRRFCFANTHTDHVSSEAREKGMLLIVERMKSFGAGCPIVFVGDHNCTEREKPAQSVAKVLKNALYLSEKPAQGCWRTWNGWRWLDEEVSIAEALKLPIDVRNVNNNDIEIAMTTTNQLTAAQAFYRRCAGPRIDYIYVSSDVRVLDYATLSDAREGSKMYPSDHFPVSATIRLPESSVPAGAFAELPIADFTKDLGPMRPELHSSGFGPTICSQTAQDLADVKAMGFKSARTHDWALINPNERVCDWHHIFPLTHLDATKSENYVFGPTDYLLKRTREEAGLDVFFRMGTSIEHSGNRIHFNALIPEDFDKVAEVFAGTVRHYNRGWANGHKWGIKYWEIWNEPEGIENMWAPPEGIGDPASAETEAKRAACRAKFVKFYVTVLKRLKSEFGDEIKVGGPAHCTLNLQWFGEILAACKVSGVAPDFISWHGYTNDPGQFVREAERARKFCDSFGFTKCELIINEWHYFGSNYTWTEMQRCSDPAVKARIWTGPDSHNGIRSSCFTLATLANIQASKLDQAFYYGCSHVGSWGFKDALQKKYKVFYALKLFGDIVRDWPVRCAGSTVGTVSSFPVKKPDGKKGLLVIDYGGSKRDVSVALKGVADGAKMKITVLDYTHDLETVDFDAKGWSEAYVKDGVLTIWKPDFFSAAFFVEFE